MKTTADIIAALGLPSWAEFSGIPRPVDHGWASNGLVPIDDVEPETRALIAGHVPPLPREVRIVADIPGLVWRDKAGRYPSATFGNHTADPRSGDAFDLFSVGWAIRGVNSSGVITVELWLPCSLFSKTITIETGISIERALTRQMLDAILGHTVVAVSSDDQWAGVDIRPQWVRTGAARGIRAALAEALAPEPEPEPAGLPPECTCGTVMAGDPPACEHHGADGPQAPAPAPAPPLVECPSCHERVPESWLDGRGCQSRGCSY